MGADINLFNATVVGENPDSAFIIENNHLHAVEQRVADLKKEKSDPEQILSLMREGLKALINYAEGKVPEHFLDVDPDSFSDQSNEQAQLIHCIENIYTHLPHHDRNNLSSLIHHSQTKSSNL